jgi:hypothetical protein
VWVILVSLLTLLLGHLVSVVGRPYQLLAGLHYMRVGLTTRQVYNNAIGILVARSISPPIYT